MKLDRLYAQLEDDEGKRKFPYTDSVGKLSIGIGRNLDDRGLRDDEIRLMLENDVAEARHDARKLFPTLDELNDVRQEVLVNMTFNLGYSRLAGFKRLRACIRAGNFPGAAREMLDSKWAEQVGARADRLAEAMRSGAW